VEIGTVTMGCLAELFGLAWLVTGISSCSATNPHPQGGKIAFRLVGDAVHEKAGNPAP